MHINLFTIEVMTEFCRWNYDSESQADLFRSVCQIHRLLEASTARLAARGAKCDSQFDCDFSYRRSVAGLRWGVKSRGAVPRQADLRPCVSLAPFGFWRVVSDSKRQGAVLAEGRSFGCDRRFARCRLYSRQSASVSPILDCESRRGCSLKRGSLDRRSAVSLV